MATPTKTRTSLWSAVTLAAGTPNTSSSINLSAAFEAHLSLRITNGATGPTLPAQFQIQVANDSGGTLFVNHGGALVGTSTNSDVIDFSVEIPIGVAAVQVVASGNTAQSVTINGDISVVSGIV
jgi:hypothetical protein